MRFKGTRRMTGKLIAGALLALVLAVPAVPAWGAAAKARTGKAAAGKAQEETSSPGLPADASHVIALPMLKGASRPPMSLSADPWKRAAAVSGLYENTGVGARPAAQPTWVYLYYNPTMLWVAFRCEGQHGNELKKEIADRDGKVWRDDSVEVMVDPTGMGKNVYHIVVNSTGNVYDAYNKEGKWDAKLVTKAATDDKGWSVTIGIPFAALKAKMPEPGQAWAANFFRNVAFKTEEATPEAPFTKVRTSWAPVLTNYETPKNYGYLLFGPENMPAVRMRLVNPVVIGKNHLTVDPLSGLQFSLRGLTDSDDVVFDAPPQAAGQGMVPFVLTEDSARKIELSLLDKQGQLLTRATYVNLSPEVASRAKALPGLADAIEKALPRFPEKARAHAQRLLPELKPIINQSAQTAADPARSSPETWDKLNRTVTDIELKLDNPACLMQTIGKLPQADFAVGLESPMAKVMIRDFLFGGWFGDGYDLFLARNEHEGFQVVVLPFEKDLRNVTVAVSELRSADGRPMAGGKVEVSLVGHVDVVDTTPYQDIEYHGWYPDPLLSFQKSCEAKAGDNVAFWIDVATAKDTPAGEYHATVTVGADDCRPVDLKLNVTVWDFVLPDGTHLRNAFTYNEPMVGRFYKDRWTREMRYKYYDFILEHRLNIDHLYRGNRPDIEVIQYGVSRGMNAFNVGGEFRNAAANNRRSKELDDYIAELKKADLFKYAYLYGFDEIKEDKFAEMRMVFGNARRMFPGLETMTTAADHSFGKRTQLRSAVDIWVPVTDWYDQDEAHQLRKEGKEMWWYICVVPYHPFANFFIEYPSIEPRLLTGTMSYKYEAGGFLYYMINLWDNNKDVVGPGPYTNWNPGSFYNEKNKKTANGDGSLFCPGPDGPLSTMRMENIRDGFEDYEYLYMLADLASAARKQADSSAARAFADKAERLLVVPDNVVRSVTEFTTNPKDLSGYRAKLAAAILEGQAFAGATAGQ